jgi:MurNAc alpha-1-phosphate uridylyltransferase
MVNNPAQHAEGDFAYQNGQLLATGTPKLTFSGIGVYQPCLFANIKRGQASKLGPILRVAIEQKLVSAAHYEGVWHDIGTPKRLADLDRQLNASA